MDRRRKRAAVARAPREWRPEPARLHQVDVWVARRYHELLRYLAHNAEGKLALRDAVRHAVGKSSYRRWWLLVLVGVVLAELVLVVWLGVEVSSAQANITATAAAASAAARAAATGGGAAARGADRGFVARPRLVLGLQLHTVPFGATSTFCRSFDFNFTRPVHATSFEALSDGYPKNALTAADRIVRTLVVWRMTSVLAPLHGGGANFVCEDQPGGSEAELLWHWSRTAPTSFDLPPEAGLPLRGRTRLVLQVVYDVRTGSLNDLTFKGLWEKYLPADSSGVQISLAPALRQFDAGVLSVASFNFA